MRYVIIGNGVAGTTAALALRARDAAADVTLISAESDYFFSRTALMYAFMDRMTLRDLEPFERKVYDKQRIRRVRGRVTGLDAASQVVRTAEGGEHPYDRLLLATGSAPVRPDWTGLAQVRAGAVHFVSLDDLAACESAAKRATHAVVAGGGLIGVELVECLVYHRKMVTFLVREPWYWPSGLAGEESEMISAHIRSHGVDVRFGVEVREVTSSGGEVRAVITNRGTELPCQMLGIAVGVTPAVSWLRDVATPPEMLRGIVVSPSFRTSLDKVFAAGDCSEIRLEDSTLVEQIWYSAKRQGELAARAMLGDDVTYQPPVFYNSAKFFGIEYTTVGRIAGGTHLFHRFPGREASVRIIEEAGAVAGFNMLGSRWNHATLIRWIEERRSLDFVLARLDEAQFDVEFGRLDLAPLRKVA